LNLRDPRVYLSVAALSAAALVAAFLIATGSPVAGRPPERAIRTVRVVPVHSRNVELTIQSQGTVAPRTESELIPEVSGRVVWTSPALVSGGYFAAEEALLRLDRADLEAGVESARAVLSRAGGEYAHARDTLERQRELASRNIVSATALDDATRNERVMGASVREARVALEQAERDLARTEIRAPFSGRVRDERVDVGQFVKRGQSVATLYATDAVEVRLPIADAQLAYLDLPLWQRSPTIEDRLPEVELSALFAGRAHTWHGRMVRTEGEIDPKSRFVHIVARVENDAQTNPTPPPVGLFVNARISGRRAADVAVIPRAALQDDSRVLVVDDEDRLRFRSVELLRIEGDDVFVRSGLASGERVCVSTLTAAVDGMQVHAVAEGGGPPPGDAPATPELAREDDAQDAGS
jgi:RND family efflux transporter MFP subunit